MRFSHEPIEGEKVAYFRVFGDQSDSYRVVVVMAPGGKMGVAACSPADQFSRKRGLAIARGRARKALGDGGGIEGPRVDSLRIKTREDWLLLLGDMPTREVSVSA